MTDPIAEVTRDGVVTADGTERPVDVIVVATGFPRPTSRSPGTSPAPPDAPWPTSGARPAWRRTRARRCPANLFVLVGPNTGRGHTSMVFIIEAQVAYLRGALRAMRESTAGARSSRALLPTAGGTRTCSGA